MAQIIAATVTNEIQVFEVKSIFQIWKWLACVAKQVSPVKPWFLHDKSKNLNENLTCDLQWC